MELETVPRAKHIHFTDNEQLEATEETPAVTKLRVCEVCACKDARYTCPRCEVKTCSLRCANIHKRELECSGERDRTKFIPIKNFDNFDLASDYRLLEEITRSLSTTKKLRSTFGRSFNSPELNLPHHLYKLRQSLSKHKTHIKFLPYNFDRHRRNTTKVNFKDDIVYWHIEWVFTNAGNLHVHDELVNEHEKLAKVLRKYFVKQENSLMQEKLQYYQSAGLNQVRVLMRAEGKRGLQFYDLDPSLTLRECFRGKTIIEFPVIQVVFKDHIHDLKIIDSDDEDDNSSKSGCVINKIIRHSESEESIYHAMKNLLFISEHSDGEMSE